MDNDTRTDERVDLLEAQVQHLTSEVRRLEHLREYDRSLAVGDSRKLRGERAALEQGDGLVGIYPPGDATHTDEDGPLYHVAGTWRAMCHCEWTAGADTRDELWHEAIRHVALDHRGWPGEVAVHECEPMFV